MGGSIPIPAGATVEGENPAAAGGGSVPIPGGATIDGMPALPAKYGGAALQPQPPKSLKDTLMRNAAPIAAQTGGQIIGDVVGTALAPETGGLSEVIPLLVGAMGAGAANVAASKLPEKYGGTPGESAKSSFLWGAIPTAVGGGITRAIGSRMAAKAAAVTAEDTAAFEKQAGAEAARQRGILAEGIQGKAPTQAQARRAGHLMGSPTGVAEPPVMGEARTAATNEATDAVMGPINRMREKLGKPIGDAYSSLKGADERISPEQAQGLSQAAQSVKEGLISPAPKAAAIFRQLQRYGVTQGGASDSMRAVESTFGGSETIGRGTGRALAPTSLRDLSPEQIQQLRNLGHAPTAEDYARVASTQTQTPSYDELRELRQYVATKAQSAQGGDKHALRQLQGKLDDLLVDRLPPEMGQLRSSYRGFIKNYPWSDVNKLRSAGTPEEAGQWLFSQKPSVANEIITNATPQERGVYKQLFAQNVLTKVDPAAPAAQQRAVIRRMVSPYLRSGTAQTLYGPAATKELSDFVNMPGHVEAVVKDLKSPKGQQLFDQGFMVQAKQSGKADLEAARKGYEAWFQHLPPESQAVVSKVATPLAPPADAATLRTPAQSLSERLRQPKSGTRIPQFVSRYAAGTAAMGLAGVGAATGSSFMMRAALGFGVLAVGAAGRNALMKAGGADLMAKMYSNPASRALGAQVFKTLVQIGGRAAHQEMQPEDTKTQSPAPAPAQ